MTCIWTKITAIFGCKVARSKFDSEAGEPRFNSRSGQMDAVLPTARHRFNILQQGAVVLFADFEQLLRIFEKQPF